MNVFMAAVYTNNYMPGQRQHNDLNEYEKTILAGLPHILESYHYVKKQKYVDEMRNNAAKVFLDSGAFSAFTLKVDLTVPEYCEYIHANRDLIRVEDGIVMASVLDGIGDAQQTWVNQQHMEFLGAKPLPCFHANEDERYLEYYVKNYEYITLGGMVGASTKQLTTWLDRIWDRYLIDGSGRARLKVHGFGITSRVLMQSYPWHSCDSSSWIQSASFGSIETPQWGPLSISEKSPSRHDFGQHISTLSEIHKEVVLQTLERQGFTFERLSTTYQSRVAYNLWAYGVINAMINASRNERFKMAVQELF